MTGQVVVETGRLVDAVRDAVTGIRAVTDADLRRAALASAADDAAMAEPYETLVRLIADASYRVTDAHVDAVRDATGSDKGAFEIVMAACVGAGIARWDIAVRAIEDATDAPA